MKKFLRAAALAGAALTFAAPRAASGQEGAAAEPRPRKIDEFGRAQGCDHGARLDNFAAALMNNPGALGHVIAYGPAGERNSTAEFRLRVTRDYLVNQRGLAVDQQYGVDEGRLVVRFLSPLPDEWREACVGAWVVPPGAEPPDPGAGEGAEGAEVSEAGDAEDPEEL